MRRSILTTVLFIALLLQGCGEQQNKTIKTLIDDISLRKIGTGDRRLTLLNAVLLDPQNGADASLLQTTHNYADGWVVNFQPSTGKTRMLDLDGAMGAWAMVRKADQLYIGSHQPGILYRYDGEQDKLLPIPIPRPNGEEFYFIWSADIGDDGCVYFGTYPEAALLRYDPQDGSFYNYGSVVEGENYVRHVNARFPGKIFCGVGAHAALVRVDAESGEKRSILPEKYRHTSFVYHTDRVGNMLMAVVSPMEKLLFFDPESCELLREVDVPEPGAGFGLMNYDNFVEVGEALYFGITPGDNLYRYDYSRNEMTLVAAGVGVPFGLAQDRFLFCRDYFATYRVFDLERNEVIVERSGIFTGSGMDIFALYEGVDGAVAGGSYINQGFFIYDPASDRLTSFGAAVNFGGQMRVIAPYQGKYYLGHYTHARLSVYDPSREWLPGGGPDANPRVIGPIGHDQDRFAATYVGEDGKLYFGTTPEYGILGGTLTVFDPESEEFAVFRHIVADQAVFALTGDGKGTLYGATSVTGGLGAKPTATEAKLFAWDMVKREKIWERQAIAGAQEIWDLLWMPDNRLIGAADSNLFIFDLEKQQTIGQRSAGAGKVLNLVASQDGWIYGNSETLFFRVSPDLQQFEAIDRRPPMSFGRGLLETRAGQLFIGIGADLYEVLRAVRRDH